MSSEWERSKTKAEYDNRRRQFFQMDVLQGGGSAVQVLLQPDVDGEGGFLYMSRHINVFGPEERQVAEKMYGRLDPNEMRRLAHALLYLADESEAKVEVVLPPTQ